MQDLSYNIPFYFPFEPLNGHPWPWLPSFLKTMPVPSQFPREGVGNNLPQQISAGGATVRDEEKKD